MKRALFALVSLLVILALASCTLSPLGQPGIVLDGDLDADFAKVLEVVGTPNAAPVFEAFDAKYGSTLAEDFAVQLSTARIGGDSDYPPLVGMPFNRDGAVYLSGGGGDVVSEVINWVAPKSFPGGYYHGAALDLAKFDPNNLDAPALQTAVAKGAGYESANDWMRKINACVLNQTFGIDQARLDAAQAGEDYYCNLPAGEQAYGFFRGYVNIFNVVPKDDTYWWYCTKVVWDMYRRYGVEIDTNSLAIDFTRSGLYSLVKTYYNALYFYSPSKARAAIAAYVADARAKIVLAEEIMLSPNFQKVFEAIRL